MGIINFAIHTLFWILGFFFLIRIPRCKVSTVRRKAYPSVSIIIPARNEENALPILLSSLRNQSFTPDEVIVVVGQSEDKTKHVAEKEGVIVIEPGSSPEGWLGKPWACYRGAKAAKGEIFIFLDADTFLEKDGLKRILDAYLEKDGVISIQPYHRMRRLYEQFSVFFNVIGMGAMGTFTVAGSLIKPIGLFGPCIVMRRETYWNIGGHREVKGEIAEDIILGERFKQHNIHIYCYGGKSTISFRMYPNGIRELIDGWSKNFATGAAKTPLPLLLAIIAWFGGGFGAAIYLIKAILNMNTILILSWASLYLFYITQIYWMMVRVGKFKFYTALLYPVPMLFFLGTFCYSAFLIFVRKCVSWKGRTISLRNRTPTE